MTGSLLILPFEIGNRNMADNYRPVSLTSQVCKIFETIICDAMVRHLEENSLLIDSQHGFRKGRSCLTSLLSFTDKVSHCLDSDETADTIFGILPRHLTRF